MRKFVVSGGPHTGKTTLIEAIRNTRPDITIVSEAGTVVINEEYEQVAADSNYAPAFPWTDYTRFSQFVIRKTTQLEDAVPPTATISLHDRGHIDTIGYATHHRHDYLVPELTKLALSAGYEAVLFCEPVTSYETTTVRYEDSQEAAQIHSALFRAYHDSGIQFHTIALMPVADRVDFVLSKIIAN